MDIEKLKKTRTVLRSAVTKIINSIENEIKNENFDIDVLEEQLNQLNIKSEDLKVVDKQIEPHLTSTEYGSEINTIYEYADKISVATFRTQKKLKVNSPDNHLNSSSDTSLSSANENKHVKLPKLNIEKFNGDCTEFYSFYNTFKVSIHENCSLSKTEKFNYLKSYLIGPAASAIKGLEISDANYDTALSILEQRFGQKDIIINQHMNNLLNLSPVYKASDISGLKSLHNEIEINVRSLSALGLKPESYSSMLVTIILKIIPHELALEYNRQNTKYSTVPDINQLLNFLQNEMLTRERTYLNRPRINEINKKKSTFFPQKRPECSMHSFLTEVKGVTPSGISQKTDVCLFCEENHSYIFCNLEVEKKKDILKKKGLCFLCTGRH